MKKCTFIVNSRHSYFNLDKLSIDDWAFHLIIEKNYSENVSVPFLERMQQVDVVDVIDVASCIDLIPPDTACVVCCDENLLLIAAKLRALLNIKGAKPGDYIPFSSKRIMKQILAALDIAVPKFFDFDGDMGAEPLHQMASRILGNTYIVKPLNGASSKGVGKISRLEDLEAWFCKSFQREESYTVEEFIDGDMYFCDSFVLNGEITFSEVSKYLYPCLDFVKGKPLGAYPIKNQDVLNFNEEIIRALKPPNGALHMECMIQNGKLFFIEIGARPPGKTAVLVHEKNYGVNLYEATLKTELGLPYDFKIQEDLYHSWIVLSSYPGVVHKLNPPKLRSEMTLDWAIKEGDVIDSYPSHINHAHSAFLELYSKNYEDLLADIEILKVHKPYLDWGAVTHEYASFRPAPPLSFFQKLKEHGIGLPHQDILDLGTGVGFLANQFAKQQCNVLGVDISSSQIEQASAFARKLGLDVTYVVSSIENLQLETRCFDVATAMQCWLYFDKPKTISMLKKALKPNGVIMIGHFDHLPNQSDVALISEKIIKKYNPTFSQGGFSGEVEHVAGLNVQDTFFYDEEIPFTLDSWIGRMIATQAIGTILTPKEISAFRQELRQALDGFDSFKIPHRLSACIAVL